MWREGGDRAQPRLRRRVLRGAPRREIRHRLLHGLRRLTRSRRVAPCRKLRCSAAWPTSVWAPGYPSPERGPGTRDPPTGCSPVEVRRRTGAELTDPGPMRAANRQAPPRLGLQDRGSAWPSNGPPGRRPILAHRRGQSDLPRAYRREVQGHWQRTGNRPRDQRYEHASVMSTRDGAANRQPRRPTDH